MGPVLDSMEKFVLDAQGTIRAAMQLITENWREFALVVDSGRRVIGVITDGDIRRGLLAGLTLESSAAAVMTLSNGWWPRRCSMDVLRFRC